MTLNSFFEPLFDLLVARHGEENLKNALDELAVEPGAGDALSPIADEVRQHLIDDGIIVPHDGQASANESGGSSALTMLIKGGYVDNGHRTLRWYRELVRRETE